MKSVSTGLFALAMAAAGCSSEPANSSGPVVTPQAGAPAAQPPADPSTPNTPVATPPSAGAGQLPPLTTQPPASAQPPAATGMLQPPAGAGQPPAMVQPPAGSGAEPSAGGEGMTTNSACGKPGLQLEGLMYSPGGDVLPYPCEPFHATDNNPYAIKCVDAWSWYDSGFPGDEYCILPPEPGKGIQIGVHPQGVDWYDQVSQGDLSGYEMSKIPDGFVLRAGGEEERNYKTSSSNTEQKRYYRNYVRMRSGSHHMIVSSVNGSPGARREFWAIGNAVEGLFGGTGLPGAQRPDANVPYSLDKPAEDAGLYRVIGPDQTITFNMHHFNPTNAPALKEAWTNLWFEEADASIPVQSIFGMPLTQAAQTFAQPGQTVDVHYSWPLTRDIRLIDVYGHRHAWTSNFSAWVKKPDGSTEVIYQSFNWFDQPTYRYDTLTENPLPDHTSLQDGATSGVRTLKAGEELHFNCHMTFTPERAAQEDAPMPSSIGPLRFANQAFKGEMCILFGHTAQTRLGNPLPDLTPVPDFAKAD